jgi:hypothetical protein
VFNPTKKGSRRRREWTGRGGYAPRGVESEVEWEQQSLSPPSPLLSPPLSPPPPPNPRKKRDDGEDELEEGMEEE